MKALNKYINEKLLINKDVDVLNDFEILDEKYNFSKKINFDNLGRDMRWDILSMFTIDLVDILNIPTNKKVTKRNARSFLNIETDNDEFYYCNYNGDTTNYKFKTNGKFTLGEIVLEIAQVYLANYEDFKNEFKMPDIEYLENLIEYLKK